ncbi:MAG: hypothetical protein A3F68_06945 [Acidobacteria bacterium RIFCSPLOWO2_12_FULL_54_10]|nr:MAG: hypothetical protein A3F68_06945 [Acidobacteria bacterium RIFCSPLOWO2_12_FULL_54_10]
MVTFWPTKFAEIIPASIFAVKSVCQFYQIHFIGDRHIMPHRKKKLTEMTDKQVLRKLFPKEIVKEVEKTISDSDKPRKRKK